MIRIYLAEDSPTVVEVFRRLLEGDPELKLVGVASDGLQAAGEIPGLHPDILVTDLHMPRMDGMALIRWVMDQHPIPILVLSNTAQQTESTLAFKCLEAGATAIGPKIRGGIHLEENRKELHRLLRVLAGVRVVRRKPESVPSPTTGPGSIRLVGVGASTGGPQALQGLFQGLSADFPVPIVAVQHIAHEFLEGLTRWFTETTPLRCHVALDGAPLIPGQVHFAPSGRHLEVTAEGRLRHVLATPGEIHVPSVDRLFHSLARHFGANSCGVLLTGMGRDGAEGLKAMRKAGAWTVAQAEAGCMVYGMPKAAVDLEAACTVLDLGSLPGHLKVICKRSDPKGLSFPRETESAPYENFDRGGSR